MHKHPISLSQVPKIFKVEFQKKKNSKFQFNLKLFKSKPKINLSSTQLKNFQSPDQNFPKSEIHQKFSKF